MKSNSDIVWISVRKNHGANSYHTARDCYAAKKVPTTRGHAEAADLEQCMVCLRREDREDGARRRAEARA